MTQSLQSLLEAFDRLPDAEKHEAVVAILGRVRSFALGVPTDEELVLSAEAVFIEMDHREAADGHA